MSDATAFSREEVAKFLDAAQYQGYFVSPKGTKYRRKVPNALKYKALLLIHLDTDYVLGNSLGSGLVTLTWKPVRSLYAPSDQVRRQNLGQCIWESQRDALSGCTLLNGIINQEIL
jgi:hypothetical protein